jgi:hypothetical protein
VKITTETKAAVWERAYLTALAAFLALAETSVEEAVDMAAKCADDALELYLFRFTWAEEVKEGVRPR